MNASAIYINELCLIERSPTALLQTVFMSACTKHSGCGELKNTRVTALWANFLLMVSLNRLYKGGNLLKNLKGLCIVYHVKSFFNRFFTFLAFSSFHRFCHPLFMYISIFDSSTIHFLNSFCFNFLIIFLPLS